MSSISSNELTVRKNNHKILTIIISQVLENRSLETKVRHNISIAILSGKWSPFHVIHQKNLIQSTIYDGVERAQKPNGIVKQHRI